MDLKKLDESEIQEKLETLNSNLENVWVLENDKLTKTYKFKDFVEAGVNLPKPNVAVSGDDPALLQYTGGTTGLAKGATGLHSNLVSNAYVLEEWIDWEFGKEGFLPGGHPVCAAACGYWVEIPGNDRLSRRRGQGYGSQARHFDGRPHQGQLEVHALWRGSGPPGMARARGRAQHPTMARAQEATDPTLNA